MTAQKKNKSKNIDNQFIELKGVRVNNLKDIDVKIPRGQLVVITGVSGSGKSSLAFDTLYAEGQRRYVESLSSYARQFLGRQAKPECDFIKGLPPAVAIEQRVVSRNPRSTVATSTEIYEYLRLLFARVGKLTSPISGELIKKHTEEDVFNKAKSYPEGTKLYLLAPIVLPEGRNLNEHLQIQLQQGYSRLWLKDEAVMIEDFLQSKQSKATPYLLIDRMKSNEENLKRLFASTETAFFEGHGACRLVIETGDGELHHYDFSNILEDNGRLYLSPSPELFSFNNPRGACPECEGFGQVMGIDESLVIPNQNLSIYEGCVACWRGEVSSKFQKYFIQKASQYKFPIHRAYNELTEEEKSLLWEGIPIENDDFLDKIGINSYFDLLKRDMHKIQNRVRLAHFRGKSTCPQCRGKRLTQDALCVLINGKNIHHIVTMTLSEAKDFFDTLKLSEYDEQIASRLLLEIRSRLGFLLDVGLGYLTLDRMSNTLSGGESQRITLATQLGSSLVGSLYVLDEPSIGLHQRDTERFISVLQRLKSLGNTVVVVEHDEEVMRAADYIIDIGPDAGILGGEVVYAGPADEINILTQGYTAQYLTGMLTILVPKKRRKFFQTIDIIGAKKHNLKKVSVKFPLNTLTVVTGVSGSGKSTLVKEILYEGMRRIFAEEPIDTLPCQSFKAPSKAIQSVEYVDQNNLSKNSRSNPCIYIGAYDDIRDLFAMTPLAQRMGYTRKEFSFNTEGGRCETCKGDGYMTVEMQFMADLELTCEDCEGRRFQEDILDVEFEGKNIYDMLEMTVEEAINFFSSQEKEQHQCRKIVKRLMPLKDVGLSYIKLGQSSSSLSGGENQRVKLASYLAKGNRQNTLFIFDEPTTGLHFNDIKTLLKSINALVDKGHSVIIIEHNLEVIKSADWIIDLGPEGGSAGGELVAEGTPEEVCQNSASVTGQYLKKLLP